MSAWGPWLSWMAWGVLRASLNLQGMCEHVCLWRTILWSSREADAPSKNGLVSDPENSAQGQGLLMERILRLQNTCSCEEEHYDGPPSYLWKHSGPWTIKLSSRDKCLINKDHFCHLPTWGFISVKPSWQYSHFSMDSIYLFPPWVSGQASYAALHKWS